MEKQKRDSIKQNEVLQKEIAQLKSQVPNSTGSNKVKKEDKSLELQQKLIEADSLIKKEKEESERYARDL